MDQADFRFEILFLHQHGSLTDAARELFNLARRIALAFHCNFVDTGK